MHVCRWLSPKMKRWMAERDLPQVSIPAWQCKTAAGVQAGWDAFKQLVAQEKLQLPFDVQAVSVAKSLQGWYILHVQDTTVRRAGQVDSAGPEMLPHPLYFKEEESDGDAGGGGGVERAADRENEQGEDDDLVSYAEVDDDDDGLDNGRGYFDASDSPLPESGPVSGADPCSESSNQCAVAAAIAIAKDEPSSALHTETEADAAPAFAMAFQHVYATPLNLLRAREPDLLGIKRALIEECDWRVVYAPILRRSCILTPWAHRDAARRQLRGVDRGRSEPLPPRHRLLLRHQDRRRATARSPPRRRLPEKVRRVPRCRRRRQQC